MTTQIPEEDKGGFALSPGQAALPLPQVPACHWPGGPTSEDSLRCPPGGHCSLAGPAATAQCLGAHTRWRTSVLWPRLHLARSRLPRIPAGQLPCPGGRG